MCIVMIKYGILFSPQVYVECLTKEMLTTFGSVIKQRVSRQMSIRESVSDIEWELIKPSRAEDAAAIVASVVGLMGTNSKCCNPDNWLAKAIETQGEGNYDILEVASWTPLLGFDVKDSLFPHVEGVRPRNEDFVVTFVNVLCQFFTALVEKMSFVKSFVLQGLRGRQLLLSAYDVRECWCKISAVIKLLNFTILNISRILHISCWTMALEVPHLQVECWLTCSLSLPANSILRTFLSELILIAILCGRSKVMRLS